VINPQGQGRKLGLYSWGYREQIRDLLRMPKIVCETLPWFQVEPRRVYALGGSMGGQETLLLVAHRPDWLAGAAAFDSPTDMARRYHDFPLIPNGKGLQALARRRSAARPRRTRSACAPEPDRLGAQDRVSPGSRSRSGGAPRIGSSSTRAGALGGALTTGSST